jgi:glycosyltransferase involved in cell wall biosynthesis
MIDPSLQLPVDHTRPVSDVDVESPEVLLSVIVPVYDQANVIADNVRVICERVAAGIGGRFEVIVVSDGSVDGTAERVLDSELPNVRVLYYDRNLGKGYAVKTGAREARGRWVGYVDADLDLDPAALPEFVAIAERENYDFVVGSKRHTDSDVHYPRSRVAASWLYQQLVRVLFRLEVRDTQVGLKVFRREVADEVLPLLLVKRYAFDIELLAVARAFGYKQIKEMPVILDYRFSGSGVRSLAVFRALFDTFAVFYRLRILGHYQRRLALNAAFARVAPGESLPTVTVIEQDEVAGRRDAAEAADGEILAFLESGARPSANWLSSTTPFFVRTEIDAVVTPQMAPAGGNARERAAAAIAESRAGGGSLRFRFTPGAIRFVSDFPAVSFLVRRERFLSLHPATAPEEVVLELGAAGRRTIYLPEASVTVPPAPLFLPHLRRIALYGRTRGVLIRRRGLSAARASTVGVIALLLWALLGWLLILAGRGGFEVWLSIWIVYVAVVAVASFFAGLRFYSLQVGFLAAVGLPLTHAVYAGSFVSGFARGGAAHPDRRSQGGQEG